MDTTQIAAEIAYTKGFDEGKQAAAKEMIEDLVKLGACSRGIVLNPWDIQELKEKWGIE
jgi:hypothetical protein